MIERVVESGLSQATTPAKTANVISEYTHAIAGPSHRKVQSDEQVYERNSNERLSMFSLEEFKPVKTTTERK